MSAPRVSGPQANYTIANWGVRMCNLEAERWLPVVGFEGLYDVSDRGRVRRIGKSAVMGKGRGGGVKIGRILKAQPHKGGYRHVFLWKGGRQYQRLVHVLVAKAFLGACPVGQEVNHKRGTQEGDSLDNLEYMTHQENCQHAYDTGLRVPVRVPSKRRKPRATVPCACGCGMIIETPDQQCRPRRFVSGHNKRGKHERNTVRGSTAADDGCHSPDR